MLNYFDVIKAQSGIPVKDIWAQLWGNTMRTEYVITTYTGTLPATLTGTKAGYLESYLISGNMEQTGTPTPSSPIYPSECGVRTENLFSGELSQFNNVGGTGNTYAYFYIPEDFTLTLIAKDTHTVPSNTYLGVTKDGGQSTGGITWAIAQRFEVREGSIFTVKSSTNEYHYVSMYQKTTSTLSWILEHYYVMLNLGSTPLPYEPYGYKLPLVSAGQDVDIYLGEVQTTRRIKKLVLDGTENWGEGASNYYIYTNVSGRGEGIPNSTALSTHTESGAVVNNNGTALFFKKSVFVHSSIADFKIYLVQQYANGTPVTVWYVLATEETAVVNEPLMKIGDYADTVSMKQAGVSIPTITGETTISWAGEGLAPSEVELTYRKPKG